MDMTSIGKTDFKGCQHSKSLSISLFQAGLFPKYKKIVCLLDILMLKKKKAILSFVKCIVFRGSLTCQRYVDEIFRPHVLQIYLTVGNNVLFQQDISSTPAIWQGTVCRLGISYPLDWPSGARPITNRPPPGYSRRRIYDLTPSKLPYFPTSNTSC